MRKIKLTDEALALYRANNPQTGKNKPHHKIDNDHGVPQLRGCEFPSSNNPNLKTGLSKNKLKARKDADRKAFGNAQALHDSQKV